MTSAERQSARLLLCGFIAATTALHGQMFSGLEATESQLAAFVKQVRQLQPGRHTADDVTQLVGAPHARSNDGSAEVWHFGFLVAPDAEAAEAKNLEEQITQLEKQRSSLRERQFKVSAEAFRQRSDALFAEDERLGAAIDEIEERLEPLEARRREMTFQRRMLQVDCNVAFDSTRRVSGIEVGKFSAQGRELIYSRTSEEAGIVEVQEGGTPKMAPHSQASATPPESPSLGQIYFNTTEKSFYGWNGTAWDKLGNN